MGWRNLDDDSLKGQTPPEGLAQARPESVRHPSTQAVSARAPSIRHHPNRPLTPMHQPAHTHLRREARTAENPALPTALHTAPECPRLTYETGRYGAETLSWAKALLPHPNSALGLPPRSPAKPPEAPSSVSLPRQLQNGVPSLPIPASPPYPVRPELHQA